MSSERRRLAEAGLGRARARLDALEERFAALERSMSGVEDRLENLEFGLPSFADLQQRRYEAIAHLRSEGWSISAISRAVNMSRSRVGALVRAMPTPERVLTVNGAVYPARQAIAAKRRNADPPQA